MSVRIIFLRGSICSEPTKKSNIIGHQIINPDSTFRRKLYFHVIADNEKLFSRLVNSTAEWPEQFRKKIKFMMHDVWYPPVGAQLSGAFYDL